MITQSQETTLADIRQRIRKYMSEKRLNHTYAVEREVAHLAEIYAPDSEFTLRVAALLHDITKGYPLKKQLQLCIISDIIYTREETMTPKIFHSRTAAAVIRSNFSEWAVDEVLSPIRWHTTGRIGMSICEQLLFLADFIEDTRTFESCVELRRFFYDGLEKTSDDKSRIAHLRDTMILAFDFTINELVSESLPIHADTVAARNYFICERARCDG